MEIAAHFFPTLLINLKKFLFQFQLTYSVILVSGVQYSDSTLWYNTQGSSQQVPSLILITISLIPHNYLPSGTYQFVP